MNWSAILFYALAVLTGISAIAVVVTNNIVRMATWLLFTLAGTSGIFFLLGFDFVAATQLFVYVGGTLVLVVFGVMLTAQGPFVTMKTGPGEWAVSTLVGLLLFAVLAVTAWTGFKQRVVPTPAADPGQSLTSTRLGESLIGMRAATPAGELNNLNQTATEHPPRTPMAYLLPFEIVSVHLLVVLIGAAYLARAKRRRSLAADNHG
jgi:NADH:ubiquinone oxidoreductase subunit 6 (subunit J)